MTIKQKFSSIDQSKLSADQKAFLEKIKSVTKDFTDAEMNKKVEAPLDGFIAKAKEKMPEAIKSAPVRRTSTKAKPSQTRKPKRTAMSLAKEIRKEGESWNDARARASKMMKEDSKDLSKTVETELDKLTKLVRSQKSKAKLTGISGTDLKRDASRKAKPRGERRVTHSGETSNQYGTFSNKLGRKYYESRDRHSDRLAPNYPKNAPLLENGAYLTDPNFGGFQNQVYANGGGIRIHNGREYSIGRNWTNDFRHVNKAEEHEVNYKRKRFAIGGGVGDFDVKLLVGKRVVYENRVDTLKKAQRIASEILDWNGDGFEYTIIGYDSSNNKIFENKRLLSDEFPAKLKYKFDTLQLNIIVANPKQNKLDAGSFNTYKALLNIVDDFEEGDSFRVTINGKTFDEDSYELGGVMATDLAGHTGGGDAGLNAGMPLDGFSNTGYTGLVGETGAMSSGEMFANGGGVGDKEFSLADAISFIKQAKKDRMTFYYNVYGGNDYFTLEPTFATPTGKLKGYPRKVTITKEGAITGKNLTYELGGGLPSGAEQSYMITEALGNPAQHFAKGGGVRIHNGREYSIGRNWTNDFRHVNKAEEHEVTYNRKGKFLGIFKDGGAIKNQYEGRTSEDVWNNWTVSQKEHFVSDHFAVLSLTKPQFSEWIEDFTKNAKDNDKYDSLAPILKKYIDYHISEGQYAKGGSVTNERRYVNKGEDYEVRYSKPILRRKGYQGKRDFMAGGSMETPRIYVADLEAYNNGRLVGEWLDLADYNDADELMDAIQDVLKKSGGEEYAIHDVEYVPRSMYSEYMGKRDFEELYEMIDLAKDNNLPLEVVQEIVSQYSASAVDDFVGKYDSAVDFAEQMVDDIGIQSFIGYLTISETDRRLLAGEMADGYVQDIRDEDGGNRLIEEAGLNIDEYEDASDESKEEMLDLASSMVNDEYYDTWYEGLNDPYSFLVEEQGMYSADDFANANFVQVDYENLARDLEQDYTFIEHDGDLYVFNIR